jgi:hypothetical protein
MAEIESVMADISEGQLLLWQLSTLLWRKGLPGTDPSETLNERRGELRQLHHGRRRALRGGFHPLGSWFKASKATRTHR